MFGQACRCKVQGLLQAMVFVQDISGPASQIAWQQAGCARPDACLLGDGVPCPHSQGE